MANSFISNSVVKFSGDLTSTVGQFGRTVFVDTTLTSLSQDNNFDEIYHRYIIDGTGGNIDLTLSRIRNVAIKDSISPGYIAFIINKNTSNSVIVRENSGTIITTIGPERIAVVAAESRGIPDIWKVIFSSQIIIQGICDSDILIPNCLFVDSEYVNSITISYTPMRERFDCPYRQIFDAMSDALDGDTIFVRDNSIGAVGSLTSSSPKVKFYYHPGTTVGGNTITDYPLNIQGFATITGSQNISGSSSSFIEAEDATQKMLDITGGNHYLRLRSSVRLGNLIQNITIVSMTDPGNVFIDIPLIFVDSFSQNPVPYFTITTTFNFDTPSFIFINNKICRHTYNYLEIDTSGLIPIDLNIFVNSEEISSKPNALSGSSIIRNTTFANDYNLFLNVKHILFPDSNSLLIIPGLGVASESNRIFINSQKIVVGEINTTTAGQTFISTQQLIGKYVINSSSGDSFHYLNCDHMQSFDTLNAIEILTSQNISVNLGRVSPGTGQTEAQILVNSSLGSNININFIKLEGIIGVQPTSSGTDRSVKIRGNEIISAASNVLDIVGNEPSNVELYIDRIECQGTILLDNCIARFGEVKQISASPNSLSSCILEFNVFDTSVYFIMTSIEDIFIYGNKLISEDVGPRTLFEVTTGTGPNIYTLINYIKLTTISLYEQLSGSSNNFHLTFDTIEAIDSPFLLTSSESNGNVYLKGNKIQNNNSAIVIDLNGALTFTNFYIDVNYINDVTQILNLVGNNRGQRNYLKFKKANTSGISIRQIPTILNLNPMDPQTSFVFIQGGFLESDNIAFETTSDSNFELDVNYVIANNRIFNISNNGVTSTGNPEINFKVREARSLTTDGIVIGRNDFASFSRPKRFKGRIVAPNGDTFNIVRGTDIILDSATLVFNNATGPQTNYGVNIVSPTGLGSPNILNYNILTSNALSTTGPTAPICIRTAFVPFNILFPANFANNVNVN